MKKEEKKAMLENLACDIEKINNIFSKMSKAQQRVEVAKDLIVRLKLDQFRPVEGKMLLISTDKPWLTPMKEVLNTEVKTVCEVCAKGGLLMAYIGRVNKETVLSARHLGNNTNYASGKGNIKLAKIFPMKQISAIEFAYEGKQFLMRDNRGVEITFTEKQVQAFKDFRKANKSKKQRLISIAQNIIDNNGNFKL